MQVVSEETLDQLLAPVLRAAQPNLLGLCDPDFSFVPDTLRRGLATAHDGLKEEVRALLELRSGYGDLMACRVAAARQISEEGVLTPYQQLRLVWSHFVRLRGLLERYLDDARQLHREALDLFAIDIEFADEGGSTEAEEVAVRSRVDRWFEVAPERQDMVTEMRLASQWPESLPAFSGYQDTSRNDLICAIDAEVGMTGPAILDFLTTRADLLVELIERYNDMAHNFRRLHERGT